MSRRSCGFTLIELLATTALAGMLLTALLQVVQLTGRTRTAMQQTPVAGYTWQTQLEAVLRSDLLHASAISWDGRTLELEGYGGRDRATGEPVHEPAIITYRLAEDVLVRDQRDLLDLGQQRPQRRCMALGVRAWNLVATNKGDSAPRIETGAADAPTSIRVELADGNAVTVSLPQGVSSDAGGRP